MSEQQDLTSWLERLGLGKYAPAFAENEIDLSILPELSDADLRDIGLPLGPRRKIQRALADDHGRGEVAETAERRQLTVMFADIVGSSAMSTRMDPEELRELMRDFQDVANAAVERYQGYIARYMGDGVLAYFGYPQAHEDDAERSVRAGLELVRMTASLNARADAARNAPLRVRVGIATGPVVVGDLIGEGASAERAVVGETPNLAARIESAAPSDSVVVGLETFRLLGDQFDARELGSTSFKGFEQPVPLYEITAERHVESRFLATRAAAPVRFVGRTEELSDLQQSWSDACRSRGSAVLIVGEAGIGKSRFLQEFLQDADAANLTIVRYQCSPFYDNTAFYPIVDRLTHVAGLRRGDSVSEVRSRLSGLAYATDRPREETIQLLASLLSVTIDGEIPGEFADSPPRLLEATQAMLVEQTLARTAAGPVLVVFEDAHWMDPTTMETTLRLADASTDRPLLLVVTSRPNATVAKAIGRVARTITLTGLSQDETELLVRSMRDGGSLSDAAFEAVVERTDGVPLFIEELTKLVIERAGSTDDPGASIPMTLADSLTERLDRLGSSKELAQIGATIGREFSHDLLSRIDGRDERLLQRDIKRLVDAGLVQPVDDANTRSYRFKHALVQDAAYGTLLHATRRQHHSRIADVLLDAFPDTARDQPEVMAYHLSESGRLLEAIDYWQAAGQGATNRSANAEAVHHLSRGIECLHALAPGTPGMLEKELALQIAMGAPLTAARGFASDELQRAYSRAFEISKQLDDGAADFRILWGLSSFYLIRGELEHSLQLQQRCLAMARQARHAGRVVQASSWLGTIQFYRREIDAAVINLENAIDGYSDSLSRYGHEYGLDPAVLANVHMMWLCWLRGDTRRAHDIDEHTLEFSQTLDHPFSHAHSLNFSVVLQCFQGNYDLALARAENNLELSGKRDFPHYAAYSLFMRGYALARLGSVDDGVRDMIDGLQARRDTGAELARPMFLTLLADVLLETGRLAECQDALDQADAIVATNGERWYHGETQRVRGLLSHALSHGCDDAVAEVREALASAERHGLRSLELRALLSLVDIEGRDANPALIERLSELATALPDGVASLDREEASERLSRVAG